MAKTKIVNGKWTPEERAILDARLKQPGTVSEVCRDVSLATGRSEKGVSCRIHSDRLTADRLRPMPDGVARECRAWEPREDMRLRKLHSEGNGFSKIALEMNRTIGSVESRARKLKLVKGRVYYGRSADSDIQAGAPLELGEGDYRYVERLMEFGGFASSTRVGGKIVFGHAGKAWVQP